MQIISFRSHSRKWRDYFRTKILPIWCIVVPNSNSHQERICFLELFFPNLQQVRWRYQISICFLTMLITIITQASSGNGNRVPNTMVLPLVGLLRLCLWLREICYAKEFSSICHKRDRGFNQSLWETLYQKGCKSMKMWCFCAWVIIDPMKHLERQRRERGMWCCEESAAEKNECEMPE